MSKTGCWKCVFLGECNSRDDLAPGECSMFEKAPRKLRSKTWKVGRKTISLAPSGVVRVRGESVHDYTLIKPSPKQLIAIGERMIAMGEQKKRGVK